MTRAVVEHVCANPVPSTPHQTCVPSIDVVDPARQCRNNTVPESPATVPDSRFVPLNAVSAIAASTWSYWPDGVPWRATNLRASLRVDRPCRHNRRHRRAIPRQNVGPVRANTPWLAESRRRASIPRPPTRVPQGRLVPGECDYYYYCRCRQGPSWVLSSSSCHYY